MHCQKNIKLRMCIICIFNQWPVLIQDQVMAEVVEFKPWWQDDLTTKMCFLNDIDFSLKITYHPQALCLKCGLDF